MLSGVVGYIKWGVQPGWYTAAQIEGYTVTRNKAGTVWSLTATVVLSDAFKMAQRPLAFVATHRKGAWTFPIVSPLALDPDTHRLTATLGPPQE
jgi:hypothetical protein